MSRDGKRLAVAKVAAVAVTAVVAILVVFAVLESRDEAPSPLAKLGMVSGNARLPPPSSGRVTMLDLGAEECPPCRAMAPIVEEIRKEFSGRADVVFIDVWKDPSQGARYGVQAIPTQIFFDARGREVFRHVGFLDKGTIAELLARLGVS